MKKFENYEQVILGLFYLSVGYLKNSHSNYINYLDNNNNYRYSTQRYNKILNFILIKFNIETKLFIGRGNFYFVEKKFRGIFGEEYLQENKLFNSPEEDNYLDALLNLQKLNLFEKIFEKVYFF